MAPSTVASTVVGACVKDSGQHALPYRLLCGTMHCMSMRNIILFILIFGVILIVGLRIDLDYCRNTGANERTLRLWGIPLRQSSSPGYRPWLEEMNVHLQPDFVDYLNYPPLVSIKSTPPGNWIYLHSAKRIYDNYPASRKAVTSLLRSVATRQPPQLTRDDMTKLLLIEKNAEQQDISDSDL